VLMIYETQSMYFEFMVVPLRDQPS
jgi:hypothetical protein